jgi:hypothetical protein
VGRVAQAVENPVHHLTTQLVAERLQQRLVIIGRHAHAGLAGKDHADDVGAGVQVRPHRIEGVVVRLDSRAGHAAPGGDHIVVLARQQAGLQLPALEWLDLGEEAIRLVQLREPPGQALAAGLGTVAAQH